MKHFAHLLLLIACLLCSERGAGVLSAKSFRWELLNGVVCTYQTQQACEMHANTPKSYITPTLYDSPDKDWSEAEKDEHEEESKEDSESFACHSTKHFSVWAAPLVSFQYLARLHGAESSELASGLYLLFHALLLYE